MSTAKDLRAKARESLEGSIFKRTWLFALLISLIYTLITGAIQGIIPAVGSIIALIITGPLAIGLAQYYIGIAKKEGKCDDFMTLFGGFKDGLSNNIVTGLLVQIFTVLWTLLFIIPGIVKGYAYAMTYYIKLDHPEYTATQAITESRKMMYGHKFRLFCLDLSFIGWYIVGSIVCGIGVLWVVPYHQAARAQFYLELKGDEPMVIEEAPKLETPDQGTSEEA